MARNNDIDSQDIFTQLKQINILLRVNNLLLSRFMLQLNETRKALNLPKRQQFFSFELLQSDVDELKSEFGCDEVNKALYKLDRLLVTNKQQCPNNIKKYLYRKLSQSKKNIE